MEKIALQMYSLRSLTPGNMIPVLKQVKAMGYDGAEFAGYDGLSARELKAAMDKIGLVTAGSHVGYDQLTQNLEDVIAYSQTLGADYIVCPGARPKPGEDAASGWFRIAGEFNEIGKQVADAGMWFGYHNHSYEFDPVGDTCPEYILFDNVDPVFVKMQLDTCWVENAGVSALSVMEKYPAHCRLLHIKELRRVGEAGDLPVGQGCIDFPAIIAKGKKLGVTWYTIEYEAEADDLLDNIAESLRYLRNIT
ncbi:MAG: sugar phosphate isomerase/epimerase family protein [Christensenellales bacterium]